MSTGDDRHILGLEQIPDGEDEAIRKVIALELQILKRTIDPNDTRRVEPPVPRGQHPKHHGCVHAEFTIEKVIPQEFRFGVFGGLKTTFPAWIRFSNARVHDDRKKGGHGMAIKLMQVEGEKLLAGQEHEQTQDFLLLDSPTFFIKNAIEFGEFDAARLQSTFSRRPSLVQLVLIRRYLYKHPRELWRLFRIEHNRSSNPLETSYWSGTPYKLGTGAVKYMVEPRSDGLPIVAAVKSQDQLRDAMKLNLQTRAADFDFYVQPQSDPAKEPVEDATRLWKTSCLKVATIHIPQQLFDSSAQKDFCENLSFNPWHSLPDHRPLGSLNRLRKATYVALSDFRHKENHKPSIEPTPETMRSDTKPAA